jgi:outer membrane lipoprotein-sorting protein
MAVAACSSLGTRPEAPRAVAPAAVSAEMLLDDLARRSASLKSFRALAQMHYVGPTDKLGIKEVIVVERPDHLRIEMMSTFGVALQIATDGTTISAYHRGDRTFYQGKATMENLSRFTRLDIDLHDIADLLVGLPPERPHSGRADLTFDRALGQWRVASPLVGHDLLVLWFDPDDRVPARARQTDPAGRPRYDASFAEYETVSGTAVPSFVRFEIPDQGAKIELRYSNITINSAIDPGLFRFSAPPGAKIVDLDQIADAAPRS